MHPDLITKMAEIIVADRLRDAEHRRRSQCGRSTASRAVADDPEWNGVLGPWRPGTRRWSRRELPAVSDHGC
jgi:hypothetical protein